MRGVFVDTGAFLAKEIARDQHHAGAVGGWVALASAGARLYSSEHVLDEVATLLARRTSYAYAAGWGNDVLEAGITWLRAEGADWPAAFVAMRKFADQGVSFTDALSFRLMRKARLNRVFGFDHHFEAAGFRLWPGRDVS